jgi:hypothetical protein
MIARCLGPAFFGLVMLAPSMSVQAANLIVVEARGIGMRVGQTVDSTKALALKEGQHLTLINPAGATLKLDGPYAKAPDADQDKGVNLASMMAALRTQAQSRVGEPGTTRGLAPNILPDPWLLDASRTGTVCLQEGATAVLWRPDSSAMANLAVMPADRSWRADTDWPAGADRITTSAQVPIRAGVTYLLNLNGAQASLTVTAVPAALTSDDARVSWMAQKGCLSQAEALLKFR